KFRRFLVRNGLLVSFREEAGVVFAALLALLYLKVVRVAVFIFGPFALHGALGNARLLVERLSTWGIAPLARVPAPRKAEIEQKWQQLLAMGIRTGQIVRTPPKAIHGLTLVKNKRIHVLASGSFIHSRSRWY